MIALGATVFDPDGHVVIPDWDIDLQASEIDNGGRRITRTATLDGRADVNDNGFTHSDRTLRVSLLSPTRELFAQIVRLAQLYPEIVVSLDDGAFIGVIENYAAARGRLDLTILIIRSA